MARDWAAGIRIPRLVPDPQIRRMTNGCSSHPFPFGAAFCIRKGFAHRRMDPPWAVSFLGCQGLHPCDAILYDLCGIGCSNGDWQFVFGPANYWDASWSNSNRWGNNLKNKIQVFLGPFLKSQARALSAQVSQAPWPRPFLAPPFGARADFVATALALPVGWTCCTLGGPCAAEREPCGAAFRGQQPGISTTLAGGLGIHDIHEWWHKGWEFWFFVFAGDGDRVWGVRLRGSSVLHLVKVFYSLVWPRWKAKLNSEASWTPTSNRFATDEVVRKGESKSNVFFNNSKSCK